MTGLAIAPPNESKNDISFDESHESLFSGATGGDVVENTLACGCTGEVIDSFGGNDDVFENTVECGCMGEFIDAFGDVDVRVDALSTASFSCNFGFSAVGVEGVILEGRLPYTSLNDDDILE